MEEAQQRINNWISDRLNLSNLGLTKIPDNLLQGLQELYLNNNKITEIPDNLPLGLRQLDIHLNEITEIPDNLPLDLQKLYLGGNKITEIPDNLPQGLQRLFLEYNQITEIPDNLPLGLQWLSLSNNEITEGYIINDDYNYDDNVYLFNNQTEYSKFYQLKLKHKTRQIIKIQKWLKKCFYKKHLHYCKEKLQEPLIANLIFKFL